MLEIVETHPTIATISNGQAVTDLQLVILEGTLGQELRGGKRAVVGVEYSQGV
ncbi:hypothetical protein QUB68_03230 [Microcoleus sp. A006_D1]|uniref:hypothetical protein n=1 Tax=Microcoleus sp. A006_D1 TaxID=3055267 RepID=UPI002FD19D6E